MASNEDNISSDFGVGHISQEEARKQHLKALRQRSRFQNKVASGEMASNNNLIGQSHLKKPPNIPFSNEFQAYNQSFPKKSFHANPTASDNSYCRRYSVASYQPLYSQQPHIYYLPQRKLEFLPVDHAGSQILSGIRPPQNVQENVEDDDVFVSSGIPSSLQSRILPSQVAFVIPCKPETSQQMLSRKRTRSAGDMVGVRLPSLPTFVYPNQCGQSVAQYSSESVSNLGATSADTSNYVPSCKRLAVAPVKSIINNNACNGDPKRHFSHEQSRRENHKAKIQLNRHSNNPEVSQLMCNVLPKVVNGIRSTSFPNSTTPVSARQSEKQVDHLASASTSLQVHNCEEDQVNRKPSSALKSFSSKSSSTKKKVVWNDQTFSKQTKSSQCGNLQTVPESSLDIGLKKVDIDSIKANLSAFTTKRKIGPYLIGPKLGSCPVKSISQYLVRKNNTNHYYMAKILSMDEGEVKSGKMLLHTEYSLLSLLSSHVGVIQQHGLFKDFAYDAVNGKTRPRVGLILDCLVPHDFSNATRYYLNLQQYVIQMKRLSEREAVRIFYSMVSTVHSLHKNNVVHRDLKLGNMVLDKRTRRITLTNFCLGCHLPSERVLLTDQRGSPAYISPDVLSDKPYAGKPSDMWSLGVVLFTMLYGQFPFYDQEPKKLFAKIKVADYSIPITGQISANTNDIIRGLLVLNPAKRLTAFDTLVALEASAAPWKVFRPSSIPPQIVPDVDGLDLKDSISQQTPINHSDLMKSFQIKMLSDDENDVPNFIKGVQKCKRRNFNSMTSKEASRSSFIS